MTGVYQKVIKRVLLNDVSKNTLQFIHDKFVGYGSKTKSQQVIMVQDIDKIGTVINMT